MPIIRVATFNCENLFSRPKLLGFRNNGRASPDLDKVVVLEKLIQKTSYSASDKAAILRLVKELARFIELANLRGKLLTGTGANLRVSASGRGDWVGGVVLRREEINIEAQKSTAAVVKALKADVVCMVEVESRLVLDDFNGQLLTGKARFSENMLIDGNDTRGIDLGILSRFPIRSIRSHIFDLAQSKRPLFSRDCPEYELALPDGQSLWVLPNHLKSKGYGTQAANDARRKEQAQGIARILGRFDLQRDLVVVAGDLNDVPGSAPLAPLLQVPHLRDAFDLGNVTATDRWTYIYKGKQQIDYLLVSKALADRFTSVGVERRGRPDIGKLTGGALKPFPTVTDWASSASDHSAVWAEFRV